MSTYEKSCKNYCSRFVDNLTDDKGIFQYRSEKKNKNKNKFVYIN